MDFPRFLLALPLLGWIAVYLKNTHTHTHGERWTPLTVTVAQVGHVPLLDVLLERQPAEEKGHGR